MAKESGNSTEIRETTSVLVVSKVKKPQVFNLVGMEKAIHLLPGGLAPIEKAEISEEIRNAEKRGDVEIVTK